MTDALDVASLAQAAREYLGQQLGVRAPADLTLAGLFDEQPLAGEGPVALFSFTLAPPAPGVADPRHYVAVGQTEPNYFPAYGLPPDDAYSLHIGTRFVLGLGVGVADPADEPPAARAAMRALVAACNPGVAIEREELAGLYRCAAQLFAVYRVTLRGQDVYCLGADCPPGFYTLPGHPPQVVLRLHLGKLIRREARLEAQAAAAAGDRGR